MFASRGPGAVRCCQKLRPKLSTASRPVAGPRHSGQPRRHYAVPASASASSSSTSSAGMLAPFSNELDRIAPSFRIHGSQIHVIQTPAEFYDTLKARIRSAKRRIFLSTLYIGKTEKDLIATLREALRSNPGLHLSILTDALRGTREAPDPSCASLLAPLVAEFGPERVDIRMYHTPNLTGLRKKHIPRRINEGWGLQHMKLYGIDDEIILSGANLSSDYFTNRQDRYHLFASSQVTDHFWRIFQGVSSLSFRVSPASGEPAGFTLDWPSSNAAPSPLAQPEGYVAASTRLLDGLIQPPPPMPQPKAAAPADDDGGPAPDTTVYMLAQLSQLIRPDTSTELPAVTHVLRTLAAPEYAGSSWTFTAGYFNPAPSLTGLLLATRSSGNTVITASPQANGFYGSKGVSGMLPDAYTYLARSFLRAIHHQGRGRGQSSSSSSSSSAADITLKEWRKGSVGEPEGWTYHAKGLWVTLPRERDPCMTIIGSSNYTRRSYSHDLEAGALVVTENEQLRRRLGQEQRWLQDHARPVTLDDLATNERRVSLKVRLAMWIVTLVGGAL